MQIRIRQQMTVAQVEIAISQALKLGDKTALVRFNPKHIDKLEREGVKVIPFNEPGYNDLYLARFINEGEQIYNEQRKREVVNEQRKAFEK